MQRIEPGTRPVFVSGVRAQQSNASGAIFGQMAVEDGASVVITNSATGFERTIAVDSAGRFRATALPPGRYNVQLVRNGQAIATRENVGVTIAGGAQVDFGGDAAPAGDATNLDAITVTASSAPSIDVSSTDTNRVTRNNRFGQELYFTDPRSIRLSARFDF